MLRKLANELQKQREMLLADAGLTSRDPTGLSRWGRLVMSDVPITDPLGRLYILPT